MCQTKRDGREFLSVVLGVRYLKFVYLKRGGKNQSVISSSCKVTTHILSSYMTQIKQKKKLKMKHSPKDIKKAKQPELYKAKRMQKIAIKIQKNKEDCSGFLLMMVMMLKIHIVTTYNTPIPPLN